MQQLWDDETRSSRSNSISSSSSQESAASNPSTPRSLHQDRLNAARTARPTVPSPLSCVYEAGSMRKHKVESVTSATQEEPPKRMSPVLKTALSLPPLHGQETWFHQPKDLDSTSALEARKSPESRAKTDSESMEVDVGHVKGDSDVTTRSESPVSSSSNFKKPKRAFLERFSPEPSKATATAPAPQRTEDLIQPPDRSSPVRTTHASPEKRDDVRSVATIPAPVSTSALMQHFVAMQQITRTPASMFR